MLRPPLWAVLHARRLRDEAPLQRPGASPDTYAQAHLAAEGAAAEAAVVGGGNKKFAWAGLNCRMADTFLVLAARGAAVEAAAV